MLRILFFITFLGLSPTWSTAQTLHLKTQEQVNKYFGTGYFTAHLIIGPDACCSDITDLMQRGTLPVPSIKSRTARE